MSPIYDLDRIVNVLPNEITADVVYMMDTSLRSYIHIICCVIVNHYDVLLTQIFVSHDCTD